LIVASASCFELVDFDLLPGQIAGVVGPWKYFALTCRPLEVSSTVDRRLSPVYRTKRQPLHITWYHM